MDVYEKDLILRTHRFGGSLSKKCIIHFVTGRVFLVVMTVLSGKNKRQTLHNSGGRMCRSRGMSFNSVIENQIPI